MPTLIITKEQVARVLTPDTVNKAVEQAFVAYGLDQVDMPAKSYLTFPKGDLRSMPAYIKGQGMDIAGIKSVNVHPHNREQGLPTVMAVVVLVDPATGFPLAVMDGTYLTSMRTGAAGALAAKLLSRQNAVSAGFVGCGAQARTQLECTMLVRNLTSAKVWEHTPGSRTTADFLDWAQTVHGLEVFSSPDIDEVTTDVDILITTTPAEKPLVRNVSPGTHINAIGADAAGKQEIDSDILKKATVVIDDWTQASHSGEINVPLVKKEISKENIHGELGRIAAGKLPGRRSQEEITLFDSTGLAIQDVASAWTVYRNLKDSPDVGRVPFF